MWQRHSAYVEAAAALPQAMAVGIPLSPGGSQVMTTYTTFMNGFLCAWRDRQARVV
ncbi:hypothetical protein THIARS_61093 [Thiomonas delicata]|uniref:Uncharacterized protein n=1 Tax=Thiomonas delicata TaxID=364030 RepID=A0A238D5D5_THIDL|nr:hypothetical protein THIARS_61093 [Thiomonas delicata]